MANPGSGLYLLDARAINDKGWVVGTGSVVGNSHAYLAIPEAEPGLVNNQDFDRGDLIGWSPKGGGIADSVALGGVDFAAKLQVWTDPYLGHVAILDQYLDTSNRSTSTISSAPRQAFSRYRSMATCSAR